jgi:predicted HD phosphohydrolase
MPDVSPLSRRHPMVVAWKAQNTARIAEPPRDALMLIGKVFAERGTAQPLGQRVSPLEHALQTARLAAMGAASDALVVASLLHDFGHLVPATAQSIADASVDVRHEERGNGYCRATSVATSWSWCVCTSPQSGTYARSTNCTRHSSQRRRSAALRCRAVQ